MRNIAIATVVGASLLVLAATSLWHLPQPAAVAATPPRDIAFKELVLDSAALARNNTPVNVTGTYSPFGLDMLYGPDHASGSLSDHSIRLMTDQSGREVREFFYACGERLDAARKAGQYDLAGCRVRISGVMTTCFLKINKAAEFPCLAVKNVRDDR